MEHPGEEPKGATPEPETRQGEEEQSAASESGRPAFSREDLDRVLDEIRPVVDDVRRALRQGFAKEDGTLRHAFARAGGAVKQWSAKRSSHKAQQASQSTQPQEADPQRIADDVRDAFGNLQKVVGEMRQSLDEFIQTLVTMKQEAVQQQPEAAQAPSEEKPQEAQAAQPQQPEEKPQEAQAAQAPPEQKPQEAQAAQAQPEQQPQEAQAAQAQPEQQPQEAQAAQAQPEEKPQEAQAAQAQPEEQPQEAQAAQPQPEEQPQEAQAAQPQPEEQPQEAQAAQPRPEEQPQEAQAAQPQPEEKPQQAQAAQPRPEEKPQEAQTAQPRPEEQRQPVSAPQEPGTIVLFDGSDASFQKFKLVGSGTLENRDGELHLQAGAGLGLAYFTDHRFDDVRLKLQFRPDSPGDQIGLAVRFQNPTEQVPDRDDPSILYPYDNEAYVAVHTGFEAQLGPKRPGTEPGTIDGVLIGDAPGAQQKPERGQVKTGDWNDLELEVRGDAYTVRLNGKETSRFTNTDSFRGKPAADSPHAGYVGILLRGGHMAVRQVEAVTQLEQPAEQQAGEQPAAPSSPP